MSLPGVRPGARPGYRLGEENNVGAREDRYREVALRVIREEALALSHLADILDERFEQACAWIEACRGRVIWLGVGQSYHVARKSACSMASLGRPAFYLHATEAIHGDMGLVTPDDLVILVSHSGETREVLATLQPLRRIGARTMALVGKPESSLARACDLALTTGVKAEAGPIKFAPSSSALTTAALGDALVMAVADSIGFGPEDYARYHPGGAIGEQLRGQGQTE